MTANKLWLRIALLCLFIGAVLVGIGIGTGGSYHNGFGVHIGKDETIKDQTIPLEAFQELEVDLDYGDFVLECGDEWHLTVENIGAEDYRIDQSDDRLTIESEYDGGFSLFHLNTEDTPRFTLTIPARQSLLAVMITSAAGDVDLADFTVEEISVDQAMGEVRLTDVMAETMKVTQAMGDVIYEGNHPGNMEVKNAMGDIEVSIEDQGNNYRYECTTALGAVKVDDQEQNGSSIKLTGGPKQADYELKLDNDMGDIELEFDDDWD